MENEIKTIRGVIEKVTKKEASTGDLIYFYEMKGKVYSSFKNHELNEGDKVQLAYVEKGKYLNVKDIVLLEKDKLEVEIETVSDKKKVISFNSDDNRQRMITLGQSANLALAHIHKQSVQQSIEDFNVEFKAQTKRFYKLITELQNELQ